MDVISPSGMSNSFQPHGCEESDNSTSKQTYTYTLTDENFVVMEEIKKVVRSIARKPSNLKEMSQGKGAR